MQSLRMLPPCELTRYRGIAVADGGRPRFMALVENALETIDSRPIGAGLLRSIANDGPHFKYKVVISDARVSDVPPHAQWFDHGSTAGIFWDPFSAWHPRSVWEVPGFVVLAHELIHARRILLGTESTNPRTSELQTVGLSINGRTEGITPNDRRGFGSITENDIRAEHGLPLRTSYNLPDGSVLRGQPIQPEDRSWYDPSA
jgi:hypothetical protein